MLVHQNFYRCLWLAWIQWLLSRGIKAVEKEIPVAGVSMVGELIDRNANLSHAFENRMKEGGKNLQRKEEAELDTLMRGFGYNTSQR